MIRFPSSTFGPWFGISIIRGTRRLLFDVYLDPSSSDYSVFTYHTHPSSPPSRRPSPLPDPPQPTKAHQHSHIPSHKPSAMFIPSSIQPVSPSFFGFHLDPQRPSLHFKPFIPHTEPNGLYRSFHFLPPYGYCTTSVVEPSIFWTC
jgi:hypothetical protein